MRLSVLAVSVILFFSQTLLAQHNSGGGGFSAGSSVGSSGGSFGGGSHSGGSSRTSSSGHSSGGSVGHSSVSHGSVAGGSHSGVSSRLGRGRQPVNETHAEKKGFFSSLLHVFHKPRPEPVSDLRITRCHHLPCTVCPAGEAASKGGCVPVSFTPQLNSCPIGEVWQGGACLARTSFLDTCSAERLQALREADRLQAAESARQAACSAGVTQECQEMTSRVQSEASLNRALQEQLRQCLLTRFHSARPFGNYWWDSFNVR